MNERMAAGKPPAPRLPYPCSRGYLLTLMITREAEEEAVTNNQPEAIAPAEQQLGEFKLLPPTSGIDVRTMDSTDEYANMRSEALLCVLHLEKHIFDDISKLISI